MKIVKIILALILMIGFPQVIISAELLDMGHTLLFTPLSYFNAFVGTAILFGLSGFRDRPKYIGNIDNNYTKPYINQNWAVFFITLVINLTVSNLCGTV
jgi:hypothetical protein